MINNTLTIADLFCGAGGSSTGAIQAIEQLGYRAALTAVNHWQTAVDTHTVNHPESRHLCADLDSLNPRNLFKPGELDILWASPECIMHSPNRRGKPMLDQSRATAWCVTRWAEALLPNVIWVENVPQFKDWGPIDQDGHPIKTRKGETFKAWIGTLTSLGYEVDWRVLVAADYGDPTTRPRLFVQGVRGKRKVIWPSPTHSRAPNGLPGWRAARSIIDWDTPGRSIYQRERPLSRKTMSRIWEGLEQFGLKPSLIQMEHGGGVRDIERPLPTITTAKGGSMAVADPHLVKFRGTSDAHIKRSCSSVDQPIGTVSAGGTHHALVEPFLIPTAHSGARRARSVDEPTPTICGNRGDLALIEPCLLPQQSTGRLRPVSEPCPTVSSAGAIALIEPYLMKYNRTGGSRSVDLPLDTITTKDRYGLVQPEVVIDGETYKLDIKFRMLLPSELAGAQGFPAGYKFTGNKTEQVKQIGNAVPCGFSRALVLAHLTQNSNIQ